MLLSGTTRTRGSQRCQAIGLSTCSIGMCPLRNAIYHIGFALSLSNNVELLHVYTWFVMSTTADAEVSVSRCEIEVFTAVTTKNADFWSVTP